MRMKAGFCPAFFIAGCKTPLCHNGTAAKDFFIIFVDPIFTISTGRTFTIVFDAHGPTSASACVCRAGHAN